MSDEEANESEGAKPREAFDPMEVGKRLRLLYESYEMTQGKFADDIGVLRTEMNSWVMGYRRPGIAKMALIMRRYPVTLDWLFLGDPSHLTVEVYRKLYGKDREPSKRDQ